MHAFLTLIQCMLFLEFLTTDELNVDREALDESYRQQHEGDVT